MVRVLPISDKAAVVLKNAEIAVIVPALGTENAKFVNVPAGLVRSMTPPAIERPGAELPNPTKAGVPISPPTMVVRVMGNPDAKGIMALAPVGPVAPTVPANPVAPVAPVAPAAPANPVVPVGPVAPTAPATPVAPVGPVAPTNPVAPVGPVTPVAPVGPV